MCAQYDLWENSELTFGCSGIYSHAPTQLPPAMTASVGLVHEVEVTRVWYQPAWTASWLFALERNKFNKSVTALTELKRYGLCFTRFKKIKKKRGAHEATVLGNEQLDISRGLVAFQNFVKNTWRSVYPSVLEFIICAFVTVALLFAKLVHFSCRCFKVQKTMTDQLSDFITSRLITAPPSLHRGRKYIGFNTGGNGELKNLVKTRNSLHRCLLIQV